MKNIIIISFSFLAIMVFNPTNSYGQDKTMDKFEIQVDGLGCPFCAYGLEKKFKKFKGIKKFRIDMETAVVTFDYPSEEPLSLENVEAQVEIAGYTAVSSKINRADGTEEISDNSKVEKDISESELISEEIYVYGRCDMCRARIEKVTNRMSAVAEAKWDEDTQMLSIKFDKSKLSRQDIELRLSQAGHDTKDVKSSEAIYKSLPKCCQYKRETN